MKNKVKALLLLLIISLVFTATAYGSQNITDNDEQADSEVIGFHVEVISEESIHDNLKLEDDCVYFSWMEFITPEQLEIAREFLGIPEGVFDDNALLVYIHNMDKKLLRYYDRIPFEDMPEDPNRIIVRMYEGFVLKHFELRAQSAFELGITEPDVIDAALGRVITDWRQ